MGTPSMEDGELMEQSTFGAALEDQRESREAGSIGSSTCCPPSPSSWPLRVSPRPVLPPRTVAQPGEHPAPSPVTPHLALVVRQGRGSSVPATPSLPLGS